MSEPHKRASVQGCRAAVATLQCLCCPFAVSTLCAAAVQCLELGDAVKSLAQGKVWSWSWAVGGCEHGMVSSLWGANSTTVSSGLHPRILPSLCAQPSAQVLHNTPSFCWRREAGKCKIILFITCRHTQNMSFQVLKPCSVSVPAREILFIYYIQQKIYITVL